LNLLLGLEITPTLTSRNWSDLGLLRQAFTPTLLQLLTHIAVCLGQTRATLVKRVEVHAEHSSAFTPTVDLSEDSLVKPDDLGRGQV